MSSVHRKFYIHTVFLIGCTCRQAADHLCFCSGVPLFYFNGQRMFSGAQNEDVFTRMLTIAAERFPTAQVSKA